MADTSGQITITDVNDTLQASLTTDLLTISCDEQRIPLESVNETATMTIYRGNVEEEDWSFSVNDSLNIIVGVGSDSGIITVTGISADSGWADIKATKPGEPDLIRTITVAKIVDGQSGQSSNYIFKRATSTPSTPSNSSGIPTGWSDTPPLGDETLWSSYGAKERIYNDWEWGVPQKETPDTSALITLHIRSASTPAVPNNNIVYTFSTQNLSGDLDGWTIAQPTENGNDLYAISAFASSSELTYTIEPSNWSTPTKISLATLYTKTIYLYQRLAATATNPSAPVSGTITWVFNTDTVGGTLGSWSQTIPEVANGTNLWITFATLSTTTPDSAKTITGWSTPSIFSQKGDNAITVNLSNDFHSIPTDEVGNSGNFTGSGTTITVYEGNTQYAYDASATPDNGTFKISSVSAPNITLNGSDIGANSITYRDYTAMSADSATVTFNITIKDLNGNSGTYSKVQSLSKNKQGAGGRTVSLSADISAFQYDAAGNKIGTTTSEITATPNGTTGTLTYRFLVDGSEAQAFSSDATYTYTPQNSYNNMPQTIAVELKEGSSVVATDSINILAIKESASSIAIILSNATHTLSADEEGGNVNYTGSGTSIMVYEGTTQLTVDKTSAYEEGTFRMDSPATTVSGTITPGSKTDTDGASAIVYAPHSGMTTDSASITYHIVGVTSAGESFSVEATQSLTKNKQGTGARSVSLSATSLAFAYNYNGDTPSPSGTTITATPTNLTGTAYYEFFLNDVSQGAASTTATYSYTPQADFDNMPDTVLVKLREGSAGGSILTTDSISLYGIKNTKDAITISFSNEAHVFPADEDGAISSFNGSGVSISVWEGVTALQYDNSDPYAPSTFYVTDNNPAGITLGTTNAATATDTLTYGNVTAMSVDGVSVIYTIHVTDSLGNSDSFTKSQAFSKSKQGFASTSYWLTSDYSTVTKSEGNTFTPTSVVFSAKKKVGDENASSYTEGYIQTEYYNGTSWDDVDSWSVAASKSITLASTYEKIRAKLSTAPAGGNIVDTEEVPVLINPYSKATINIFQRTSIDEVPSAPSSTITYTFSDGNLTGSLGGWSNNIPEFSDDNYYIWVTVAHVQSTESTVDILSGSWSTVTKLAERGAAGLQTSIGAFPNRESYDSTKVTGSLYIYGFDVNGDPTTSGGRIYTAGGAGYNSNIVIQPGWYEIASHFFISNCEDGLSYIFCEATSPENQITNVYLVQYYLEGTDGDFKLGDFYYWSDDVTPVKTKFTDDGIFIGTVYVNDGNIQDVEIFNTGIMFEAASEHFRRSLITHLKNADTFAETAKSLGFDDVFNNIAAQEGFITNLTSNSIFTEKLETNFIKTDELKTKSLELKGTGKIFSRGTEENPNNFFEIAAADTLTTNSYAAEFGNIKISGLTIDGNISADSATFNGLINSDSLVSRAETSSSVSQNSNDTGLSKHWNSETLYSWLSNNGVSTQFASSAFFSSVSTTGFSNAGIYNNTVCLSGAAEILCDSKSSLQNVDGEGSSAAYETCLIYTVPQGITKINFNVTFPGDWTTSMILKNDSYLWSSDSENISSQFSVIENDVIKFQGKNTAWPVFGYKTQTWAITTKATSTSGIVLGITDSGEKGVVSIPINYYSYSSYSISATSVSHGSWNSSGNLLVKSSDLLDHFNNDGGSPYFTSTNEYFTNTNKSFSFPNFSWNYSVSSISINLDSSDSILSLTIKPVDPQYSIITLIRGTDIYYKEGATWNLNYLGTTAAIIVKNIETAGSYNIGTQSSRFNNIYGTYVYGAVWNDIADFLEVEDDSNIQYGKVYCFNGKIHQVTKKYAQKGVIGIASDTFCFAMGEKENTKQIPFAIGGIVLAYCNRIYKSGTALVASKYGILKKANLFIKLFLPERIIGTFYKMQKEQNWYGKKVNGRHWIKVR